MDVKLRQSKRTKRRGPSADVARDLGVAQPDEATRDGEAVDVEQDAVVVAEEVAGDDALQARRVLGGELEFDGGAVLAVDNDHDVRPALAARAARSRFAEDADVKRAEALALEPAAFALVRISTRASARLSKYATWRTIASSWSR